MAEEYVGRHRLFDVWFGRDRGNYQPEYRQTYRPHVRVRQSQPLWLTGYPGRHHAEGTGRTMWFGR